MPYGGYFGGGMGFGFRGSSPPWRYVGRGRGGLPRCGYFFGQASGLTSNTVVDAICTRDDLGTRAGIAERRGLRYQETP